jgi:hypothetical protein
MAKTPKQQRKELLTAVQKAKNASTDGNWLIDLTSVLLVAAGSNAVFMALVVSLQRQQDHGDITPPDAELLQRLTRVLSQVV